MYFVLKRYIKDSHGLQLSVPLIQIENDCSSVVKYMSKSSISYSIPLKEILYPFLHRRLKMYLPLFGSCNYFTILNCVFEVQLL